MTLKPNVLICIGLVAMAACGSKTGLEGLPAISRDATTDSSREDASRDGSTDGDGDDSGWRDGGRDARDGDGGFDASIDAPFDADLCAPFVARVGPAELELRLLVDRSFSMANETSSGRTKSEELADGFARFFALPEVAGTHVSLTFFPGAPIACSRDSDCVVGGCVMPDICEDESSFCTDDTDCGELDCVPLGRCDVNPLNIVTCLVPSSEDPDAGVSCPAGIECIDFGYCENGPPWRLFRDSPICSPSFYVSPSIAAVTLPSGAELLDETLAGITPAGGTPTVPALTGLHQAAAERVRRTHRKVLVVLATDTRSTGCPEHGAGVGSVRRAVETGLDNGVPTYVLAILGADDEAAATDLATVAEAGGTELGLFSTSESVADLLVEFLREVRAEESACAYSLPTGARAGLEATLVEGGMRTAVPRADDEDGCVDGRGFYFPHDVEEGDPVGYVELCEATCAAVSAGADLEVRNRCE